MWGVRLDTISRVGHFGGNTWGLVTTRSDTMLELCEEHVATHVGPNKREGASKGHVWPKCKARCSGVQSLMTEG